MKIFAIISGNSDSYDDLSSNIRPLVQHAKTEKGCLKYQSYVDKQSFTFFFDEEWEGPEFLDAHTKSAPFIALGEFLKLHGLQVQIHQIEEI
ncbi:antibiotic biosynthesis monooxygenase [Asaia sp. BMEF1]|uniref:putative quinol monooxygenase n=1 Tax=Asaia sp. BMEF1 TaxID=3155932 RepID=UPI003F66C55B